MGKKHSTNQGSVCSSSSKDCSTRDAPRQQTIADKNKIRFDQNSTLLSQYQSVKLPEQVIKNRLDMHQRMVLCSSPPCYNYFQTNPASRGSYGNHGNYGNHGSYGNQDGKHSNIDSWLESVLENNLNALAECEHKNFVESDSESPPERDGVLLGEDCTWFYQTNQRCTPIMTCAKHQSPLLGEEKAQQDVNNRLKRFNIKPKESNSVSRKKTRLLKYQQLNTTNRTEPHRADDSE